MISALWVGGPPGATLSRLTRKLAADDIEVVDVQEAFRTLPTHVDLVLINIDMTSHASFYAARAAAESRAARWIAARTDYSRTRRALDAAGLITKNDIEDDEEDRMASDSNVTSQDLEAFLRDLPKELLPHAKTLVASRLREDDVMGAAEHLNQLDDDGLVELLAFIDSDKRKRLLTALQG
jgi:hypothetical protein